MSRHDGTLVPCWSRRASNVSDLLLLACGDTGVCNGSGVCDSQNFTCLYGFDPASRLCSLCLGGRFLSGGACVQCSDWMPILALSMVVVAIVVSLWAFRKQHAPPSMPMVSVSLFYLQLSGVLREQSPLFQGTGSGWSFLPAWLEQLSTLQLSVFECWMSCDNNCQFTMAAAVVLAAAAVVCVILSLVRACMHERVCAWL